VPSVDASKKLNAITFLTDQRCKVEKEEARKTQKRIARLTADCWSAAFAAAVFPQSGRGIKSVQAAAESTLTQQY
jgi:hypothetical protein